MSCIRVSHVLRRYRVLLAWVSLMASLQPAAAIEEPAYRSVLADGAFEVRDYAAYMVAETRVEASFDDAGNEAFRRLFAYISGDNRQQQDISMTAPVIQRSAEDGRGTSIPMTAPVNQVADGNAFRVAFVVPRKFNRNTVPTPTDPRVSIREVPAQRVAAWRFSGRWTERAFRDAEQSLRAALARRATSRPAPR